MVSVTVVDWSPTDMYTGNKTTTDVIKILRIRSTLQHDSHDFNFKLDLILT